MPTLSAHAIARQQQRGLRSEDLDLILAYGSRIDDHSIMLTDRDTDDQIAMHRHEIERLERLRGMKAVIRNDVVVTVYKVFSRRHYRRLRQRGAFKIR